MQANLSPYPTQEWIAEANSRARFTPDLSKLELQTKVLVFVYNEMQSSHEKNWRVSNGGLFCGTAFTYEPFVMWKKNLGEDTFPFILRTRFRNDDMCRVKGEIWAMDPEHVIDLDNYMLNGIEFVRERLDLIYPFREVVWKKEGGKQTSHLKHHKLSAEVYVGVPDYWNELIDGGLLYSKVKRFEPNHNLSFDVNCSGVIDIRQYYCFSKLEFR